MAILQLSPFDNSIGYSAAIWLIVQINEIQAARSGFIVLAADSDASIEPGGRNQVVAG
ncbi:hypothetical protein L810_8666 [Burkholderia sp. AU4i]|uniref:hypothetical protein n=1 Tax=Burkholderia sp. AU4i TaxID=1335308 RepID=UPI000398DEC9|nr:hypothetical protein [Burkholderia sp. AU4i]ERJ37056.1 hypothetical protein L810_8666 [Burkholderia sp. AU4i]